MPVRTKILNYLATVDSATGPELAGHLGISRQGVNPHIRALISCGAVAKSGSTKAARYYLSEKAPPPAEFSLETALDGLDESAVYERFKAMLNLRSVLRKNTEAIVHYAFTEMLNNAIDHARTDRARINMRIDSGLVSFDIRDWGIGIFESIATKLDLDDEYAAMVELIKGKTTTMPEAHSGEGVFFTSKIADRFVVRSHRIQLEWDRARGDAFVSDVRRTPGTLVHFLLRRDARQTLEKLFETYAPADYDFKFQKTKVNVKLLQTEYVSRSEARRLLMNLDKFREVVLDFKGVKSVGQGFADEVFRVFVNQHPDVRIDFANASRGVAAMLKHASA